MFNTVMLITITTLLFNSEWNYFFTVLFSNYVLIEFNDIVRS